MNGNANSSSCERFEELVSSCIDGELSFEESADLAEHLQCCSSCRRQSESFEQVSELVGCLGDAGEVLATKVVVPLGSDSELTGAIQKPLWSGLTPYAAMAGLAAALLIWLGIVMPSTNYASAKEIVTPIVTLAQINSTREEDQAIFKESLELDMRTLLLEIELLNDDESTQQVKEQYEQLLQRIKEI